MIIVGIGFNVGGVPLPSDLFRANCIAPICGTETSFKILQNICYQLFAVAASKEARERLVRYDEENNPYVEYNDYGVYLQLYCHYSDNFCIVDVVKCESEESQPP